MQKSQRIPSLLTAAAVVAAMAALLSGCSRSVTMVVSADIPSPLVEKLPLSMGVYYDETFRNHIYEEDSETRSNWAIKSGESQVKLFERIFASMFTSTPHLENKPPDPAAAGPAVDGVLHPEVVEMQFALPMETRTEFYEYWVKYKINLYDDNGDLIVEWPVTGYGKSSTEFLKSRDKGLNAAINQAMRDVGAKLAIGFPKAAAVDDWLRERQ